MNRQFFGITATVIAATLVGCSASSHHGADAAQMDRAALDKGGVVTINNFARAESDLYFGNMAKDGSFEKFLHRREPATIENQTVIRLNRDTLYSSAVFDLDAGPVTITMPDAGKRFMSLMIVNQDHYVQNVFYGPGSHTLTKANVGTRYGLAGVRILVDPNDPKDVAEVHRLQDALKIDLPRKPGTFEVPAWDAASQKKVRDALLVLSLTTSGFSHAFGRKEDVDPVYHLLGTAAGWGGNPDKDATYIGVTPPQNDGKTAYTLVVKDVPVNAFWSISVYNAKGYFEPNPQNAYSINNLTGKKNADGAVVIQFGGTPSDGVNYLPITPGWNYTVRLYRPRPEILKGTWKFPEPVVVK
jgi:hypothetical protein